MTGTYPDAWTEVALVTITKESGDNVEYATITETVDISMGDKAVEHVATIKGGRVVKYTPEDDTEITLELYPVNIDTGSANGGFLQQFYGGVYDTVQPLEKYNYNEIADYGPNPRGKFRVVVLWTDDTTVTSGTSATAADKTALRFVARNCYITSHKVAFTDDIVKITVTLKCGAANKNGRSNVVWQSADGSVTGILAALADYTPSAWI